MAGKPKLIILVCKECGEKTVLGGPEEVWHSSYTFFECECGEWLTLADRLEDKDKADELLLAFTGPHQPSSRL